MDMTTSWWQCVATNEDYTLVGDFVNSAVVLLGVYIAVVGLAKICGRRTASNAPPNSITTLSGAIAATNRHVQVKGRGSSGSVAVAVRGAAKQPDPAATEVPHALESIALETSTPAAAAASGAAAPGTAADGGCSASEALLREVSVLPPGWRVDPTCEESKPLAGDDLEVAAYAVSALRSAAASEAAGTRDVESIGADLLFRAVRGKKRPEDKARWRDEVSTLLEQRALIVQRGVDREKWGELLANSAVPGSLFPSSDFQYSTLLSTSFRGTESIYAGLSGDDFRLYGEDNQGHLVLGWRATGWDPAAFQRLDDPAFALAIWFQMWETFARRLREVSAQRKCRVRSVTFLFDYGGVSSTVLWSILQNKPYRACLFAGIDHFPEMTFHAHGVNCGWALRGFYAVAKKLVDPRTVSKFFLHGTNAEENHAAIVASGIPSEALPDWVGGSCAGTSVFQEVVNHIARK